MQYRYNRVHVQWSVRVAVLLGLLLGFWLGSRANAASWLETLLVFGGYIGISTVAFSHIDKRFLPPEQD